MKVYLSKPDMRGKYLSNHDCPLAKALKRKFKGKEVYVGATFCKVGKKRYDIDMREWNGDIAKNVKKCYEQGVKTRFYVPLKRAA